MRIAISTGGGDAPGLNAVIRAVVLSAHYRGWKSYAGFPESFRVQSTPGYVGLAASALVSARRSSASATGGREEVGAGRAIWNRRRVTSIREV
jgi:6-phosphofructokinase